jgi:hypothetical protein
MNVFADAWDDPYPTPDGRATNGSASASSGSGSTSFLPGRHSARTTSTTETMRC